MPSSKPDPQTVADDTAQVASDAAGVTIIPSDVNANVHHPGELDHPDAALAVPAEPGENAKKCPNCGDDLIDHGNADGPKKGARHCNTCGACWAPGMKAIRPGHPAPSGWGATA